MEISEIEVEGYERVARCRDQSSGLHALIAIHDTTLGPRLGGMRMLPYRLGGRGALRRAPLRAA
jgi:glutamate dehydrogenase/leucine dehydrogenase